MQQGLKVAPSAPCADEDRALPPSSRTILVATRIFRTGLRWCDSTVRSGNIGTSVLGLTLTTLAPAVYSADTTTAPATEPGPWLLHSESVYPTTLALHTCHVNCDFGCGISLHILLGLSVASRIVRIRLAQARFAGSLCANDLRTRNDQACQNRLMNRR